MVYRSVPEVKNDLPELIRMLEDGEEDRIVITRHGRPVAAMIRYEDSPDRKRIGVAEGRKLVADGWDDNDANDKITDLFLGDTEANEGFTQSTNTLDTEESSRACAKDPMIESAFVERLSTAIEQGLADIEAGRVSDDLEGLFTRIESKFNETS